MPCLARQTRAMPCPSFVLLTAPTRYPKSLSKPAPAAKKAACADIYLISSSGACDDDVEERNKQKGAPLRLRSTTLRISPGEKDGPSISIRGDGNWSSLLLTHSFALASMALCALPLCRKYSATFCLATSMTAGSSIVAGYWTSLSYSSWTAFSTSSLRTRRSVFPERVLGIMPLPWIIPPRDAMPPICCRTRCWISLKSCASGIADVGWSGTERVMNAKGSCPFSESGIPTTLASAIKGWLVMACSIDPEAAVLDTSTKLFDLSPREMYLGLMGCTGRESVTCRIDQVVASAHDADVPVAINHTSICALPNSKSHDRRQDIWELRHLPPVSIHFASNRFR